MLTFIDHLVIGVPDLTAATKSWTQAGFNVVPGGHHPTGTHNALIGLADGSYIELLAFQRDVPDHRWWQAHGLIDFARLVSNLDDEVARIRQHGLAFEPAYALSRQRPDGFELKWRLAMPPPDLMANFPFLIEDETPRRQRIPDTTQHRSGIEGIASVTIETPHAATLEMQYTSLFGPPPFRLGPHHVKIEAAESFRLTAQLLGSHRATFPCPQLSVRLQPDTSIVR